MADFKLKLGGVDSNELLSALKEMQQGAIEAEKMSESVQANNEKVIKGSTKAAQTAASNISQTVQEVEKAVTKSVDTTIKELKRLNNIDFSIKIGTGKGQKKKSIADDLYPANEDVQNVVKQLNKSKDKIENAISEYHNDIESMRSEMWKYEAKGKSHSKLTQGLFDEKEVDKAYNSFVSTNKEKLQDVKDQLIREREELYSAFNNLQNKTNTVKLGDYSDLSLNKSTLKDMVQMVEIAKMIQRYNNQIGVSDSRYENINVTDLQTKVASIAENMIKKGISKKFGQEVTQLETDANKLIEIIVGMQKGEASAFESLKTFAGNIVTPFKETKNEIKQISEELKQAKTYIDETKKTASSLSQKKKGDKYSIKATYDKPPELDSVKGGAATERDYIYVGEVTNLLKNDERLESHPGVLYLKKLIEMKPELKSLYDEIMNINEAMNQTSEPKKVSVPKDIKNPKVVDGDNQAQLEAENEELKKKNELLQQQAEAQNQVNKANSQEKQINNQNKNKFSEMSIDQLLSYDFKQGQKREATAQLEEAYNAFKDYYGKNEALSTEEGAKAAYAYYSAYENALGKEVADSRLQRYTLGDYKAEQISASYITALYSGNSEYIGQSQLRAQEVLERFKTASTPSTPSLTEESSGQASKNIKEQIKLQDNLGREIDENNSKLLEGTKLIDKQNQGILTLYHNSNEVFDKFDSSNSGTNQGMVLGAGNYLAFQQDSQYNNLEYGKYQTQWYANVQKILDVQNQKLGEEEANYLLEQFKKINPNKGKSWYDSVYRKLTSGDVIDGLSDLRYKGIDTSKALSELGYDAIKDGGQINIFNDDNIVRASNAILDISQADFTKLSDIIRELKDSEKHARELKDTLNKVDNQYIGKSKEELNRDLTGLDIINATIGGESKEIVKLASAYKNSFGELPNVMSISSDRLAELVSNYELAEKENDELLASTKQSLQVEEAKIESLKSQLEVQREIIKKKTQDYLFGQSNQTSPSSDSSAIVEENKEVIKSNEKVITSEEKKRKYTIAFRDNTPNVLKAIKANQQEAESSTSTTATVVEDGKKQAEAAEKTVKANQENAKAVDDVTRTIENQTIAIENNTKAKEKNNKKKSNSYDYLEHATFASEDVERMLQQVIDASENIPRDRAKTSVTSSADGTITGGTITYVDDALKRTVTEVYTLKTLTDEMAEATDDVAESEQALVLMYTKATDDGIARAKQEEKSREKEKKDLDEIHAKQVKYQGEIDRVKREALEHATRPIRTQDNINEVDTAHQTLTDKINTYLGDGVVSISKSAVQEIETAIADYKALVNRLQSKDNVPTMATTDFENKKAQSIFKAEGLYADLQRAGSYTADLRKEVEDLWIKLNEVGSGDDLLPLSKEVATLAEKFRALRKDHLAKLQKENVAQRKDNGIKDLTSLEKQLSQSGKLTDDVKLKLDSLLDSLVKVSDAEGLSVWEKQLKQFKSSISDLPQTFESAWNETLAKINIRQGLELNRSIGTNSIKKTIEDNVGIGRDSTSLFKDSIKGTEWTGVLASDAHDTISQYSSIVSKMKEIIELRKTLRNYENEASKNVNSDYSEYINRTKESISALIGELRILLSDDFIPKNQDILGEGRVKNFINLYDEMEVEQTRIESDRQKRQLENQKQAVIRSVAAQKQIAATFNEALQGYSLDENTAFKNASIDKNGNATLTFLEIIGDKAVETKVYIDDIATALANLQNGTFSVEGYKTSYSTRNVKADDFGGVNQNDQIQAKIDAYKQLYGTEKKYQELKVKVDNDAASPKEKAAFEELSKIREYYNKIIKETLKLEKEEQLYYESIGKASIDKEKNKYEQERTKQQGKYNAYNSIYKERINTPEIKNALESTEQLMKQISAKNQNMSGFSTVFNNAQKEVEELNSALRAGYINTETYTEKIQGIANGLNNVIGVLPSNITDIKTGMEALAKTLPNAEIGTFNGTNNTLQVTLNRGKGIIQELTLGFNQMSGAVNIVKDVTKHTEGTLGNFFKSLKNRGRALVQYLMTFASFYRVVGWVRQGVTVIRELDAALTEMRKVSDESVESLKNFQKVSFDIGNDIGATAAQIQNSAADFMRLGYSLKEAAELAEDANIYANVGDMEIDEATEHMISSIKAWESEFSSEIEASEAIIDRYNEIGNNFAISSADIGSAMERSAAALKAGGNTLNESLGLITAGNIIQQDAETTAAALKIMSLRIRGSKAELDEMGESTDGLASSTSKLRDEIKALTGVDIMLDENTYKSTAQIIQEIGASWDKLTDVSQAAVLEKLAGEQNCLKFVETHIYRTHLNARIA